MKKKSTALWLGLALAGFVSGFSLDTKAASVATYACYVSMNSKGMVSVQGTSSAYCAGNSEGIYYIGVPGAGGLVNVHPLESAAAAYQGLYQAALWGKWIYIIYDAEGGWGSRVREHFIYAENAP